MFKVLIGFMIGYLMGSIIHESDLSRNFKKTGNASAWFFEIKR